MELDTIRLAEPRRKRNSYVGLNPRGTLWANDDSKFGQKLMEKMGWSKGKGLGVNEQGHTDCIGLRIKNNTKGIGYKGQDDQWVKHYEGFENVLAALNSENNSAATSPCNSAPNSNRNSDDEGTNSLEVRSKSSQARVHYHKFTRGKDVSRYNADDLGCITGSKRSKLLAKRENGNSEDEDSVTITKAGNVQDYFAKKMALYRERMKNQQSSTEENRQEDNSYMEDANVRQKRKCNSDEELENIEGQDYQDYTPEVEKVVEEKNKIQGGVGDNDDERRHSDSKCCEEKPLKKKKKKKQKDVPVEDSQEETQNEKHGVKKSKKKRKKILVDMQENEENEEVDIDIECSGKKSKTKKKKSVVSVEKNENIQEMLTERESSMNDSQKKKKKKVVVDTCKKEGDIEIDSSIIKSKKKKKQKRENENDS